MIIKSVNLETVCGITSKLPDNTLPEVAFAGKSNVGKSSLINALMNRKSYARISAQPGKTQTINYYNINEELYYVDLPGSVSYTHLDVYKRQIFINVQEFLSRTNGTNKLTDRIQKIVLQDIQNEYPEIDYFDKDDLSESMQAVYEETSKEQT